MMAANCTIDIQPVKSHESIVKATFKHTRLIVLSSDFSELSSRLFAEAASKWSSAQSVTPAFSPAVSRCRGLLSPPCERTSQETEWVTSSLLLRGFDFFSRSRWRWTVALICPDAATLVDLRLAQAEQTQEGGSGGGGGWKDQPLPDLPPPLRKSPSPSRIVHQSQAPSGVFRKDGNAHMQLELPYLWWRRVEVSRLTFSTWRITRRL